MDDNIALLLLASCRTRPIRAKWFRRVPRLCVCLHKRQYAHGRLLFQAPLLFPPLSGVLPRRIGDGSNRLLFLRVEVEALLPAEGLTVREAAQVLEVRPARVYALL